MSARKNGDNALEGGPTGMPSTRTKWRCAVRKSALIERLSKTRPVLGSSTLELIVRIAGSVAKRDDPVAENAISR